MFAGRTFSSFRYASKMAVQAALKAASPKTPASSTSVVFTRSFSKTFMRSQGAQQELAYALESEIEAEKKLESDNLGGSSSPSIPGFEITTKDAEVRLTKNYNGEKILVVLNVNHSVDVDEESENAEVPAVPVALPPFSIEITKGNQRLCFHLDLVEAEENSYDFVVQEFYVAPAATGSDESVDETVYASSGKYIDQSLHELLFVRYLEERGFTTDFCQHLVNYATHYEHSRYVDLLNKIKGFVTKK